VDVNHFHIKSKFRRRVLLQAGRRIKKAVEGEKHSAKLCVFAVGFTITRERMGKSGKRMGKN